MPLAAVEEMIADALADEERTGRLANAMRERAAAHGRSPAAEEVRSAVGFVREYVEHVPAYLRDGLEAARMVLDDAYYSLTLMQAVSDRYEEDSGRALFPRNLQAANSAIRNLIGEPTASQIDMYIGTRLNADPMTQMVHALTAMSAHRGAFPIPQKDPIWGDRPTEEIVKARLGRLGLA